MSDPGDNLKSDRPVLRLSDVIRDVKNAAADRDDVVVELREASRTRLELLAAELAPVFAEVPADIDLFDFTISSGLQPRLWIDAVSHVAMGRDRRTYRFLQGHAARPRRACGVGRRSGRSPTRWRATSPSASSSASACMEGAAEPALHGSRPPRAWPDAAPPAVNDSGWRPFLSGLGLVAAGALVGLDRLGHGAAGTG